MVSVILITFLCSCINFTCLEEIVLLRASNPMIAPWRYYWCIQVVSFFAMIIGWFLLLPLAAFGRWKQAMSPVFRGKVITVWNSGFINATWGNYEDGVVPPDWYLPGKQTWLRVYMWTAWRNSADNLKYEFRLSGGPFWRRQWAVFGKQYYAQCGFNPSGLPVISAGAV